MANELTVTMSARLRNGNLISAFTPNSDQVDQSSALDAGDTQTIGTTHEALTFGDLSTRGYSGFTNLDSTNYVEIGLEVAATFYPLIKLLAGESALFPIVPTGSVYAKANTASVNLKKFCVSR